MSQMNIFSIFIYFVCLLIHLEEARTTPKCGTDEVESSEGMCVKSDAHVAGTTPRRTTSPLVNSTSVTTPLDNETDVFHSTPKTVSSTTFDDQLATGNTGRVGSLGNRTDYPTSPSVSASTKMTTQLPTHVPNTNKWSPDEPFQSSTSKMSNPARAQSSSTAPPEILTPFPNSGRQWMTTDFYSSFPITTFSILPTIGGNGLNRLFGFGNDHDGPKCPPNQVYVYSECQDTLTPSPTTPTTPPPPVSSTKEEKALNNINDLPATSSGETLTFTSSVTSPTPKLDNSSSNLLDKSPIISSDKIVNDNPKLSVGNLHLKCRHIILKTSMFHVDDNGSVILKGGKILNESDFRFMSSGAIKVCLNAIDEDKSGYPNAKYDRNSASVVLTNLCLVSSQVCLLLTFLLHCCFAKLRTLPGIILMLLTSSLFLAHAIFFFGSASTSNHFVCTAIGVALHYFWLSSFSWLNICSFHTFRVFWNVFSSRDFNTKQKQIILTYCIIGYGVPGVFVATMVTVNHLISGGTNIGYGNRDFCFTSNGTNTIVGLLVPAGVTVLVSSILFVLTLISLFRASASRRTIGRTDTCAMLKYIKLSSITGFSLVFGFLQLVDKGNEVFSYMFIILTGAQGVFIFLAFMVNKRVYMVVTACCRKVNAKKYSKTTSESTGTEQI